MTQLRFDDQVAIVTGGGGGLGSAYARLLAQRGATAVVHDAGVDPAGQGASTAVAQQVVDDIVRGGGRATAANQNLGSVAACQELVCQTWDRFGRVDALIHSAGLVTYKGIESTTDQEWTTLHGVNIDAPFWLCRAVWPLMRQQGGGRIVLTVSGYGLKAFEGSDVTAYGVGKAARFGLLNGLAGEGMAHDIRVNAIAPVAATRMFRAAVASGRFGADAVAPAVVFLASGACTLTGCVVHAVDGRFGIGRFERQTDVTLGSGATPESVRDALQSASDAASGD
jgi:NAD(P)-dependent dehydrogenase (short-subunit alcohol dehydrogenase family)